MNGKLPSALGLLPIPPPFCSDLPRLPGGIWWDLLTQGWFDQG